MKSTLSFVPVRSEFPRLFKSEKSGLVVLFTSRTRGTALSNGLDTSLGDHSEGWVSCYDKGYWTELPAGSTVTLTQE